MKRALLGVITGVGVFGLLAAGCASQAEVVPKPGNPDSYADGFEDGCFSGNKAGQDLFGQFMKDLARFDTEKYYALGWTDGFRQCETEQEALDRKARVTIEWQRMNSDRRKRMADDLNLGDRTPDGT